MMCMVPRGLSTVVSGTVLGKPLFILVQGHPQPGCPTTGLGWNTLKINYGTVPPCTRSKEKVPRHRQWHRHSHSHTVRTIGQRNLRDDRPLLLPQPRPRLLPETWRSECTTAPGQIRATRPRSQHLVRRRRTTSSVWRHTNGNHRHRYHHRHHHHHRYRRLPST